MNGVSQNKRRKAGSGLRGQPLLMLAMLALGWSAMRFATWASPIPEDYAQFSEQTGESAANGSVTLAGSGNTPNTARAPANGPANGDKNAANSAASGRAFAPQRAPIEGGWSDPDHFGRSFDISPPASTPVNPVPANPVPANSVRANPVVVQSGDGPLAANAAATERRSRMRLTAGHSLLMAAGFSNMEVPPEIAAYYERALGTGANPDTNKPPQLAAARVPDAAPYALSSASATQPAASRWSADGWLLWREDTTTPLTSGRPSYGRSQLGAVVRYDLAAQSSNRPQAYLRGSAALQGSSEQEVSAGLSARPLARVPIRLAAELRVSNRPETSEVRPAIYAVSELAPQQLPGGLQAEAYVQAGYVGGDFATAFVDGQARVDRSLATAGDFDLRAGAAAWGGAQRDGERLDVGPTASLTFNLGDTRGRVSADYRFRVAGTAEPASGPALTLSAGF